MNRLTCKPDEVMENYYYETTEKTINEDRIAILNKLGQLEDIEDELGIDITILFKALKNGIYFRNQNNYIEYHYAVSIGLVGLDIIVVDFPATQIIQVCAYEMYGKTWALTKEELE